MISKKGLGFVAVGALLAGAGMAAVACAKVETVNNQGTTGPEVSSCGTLTAQQAAQFAASQLEHLGVVGLASIGGLENSRVAASLITLGNETIVDPFVADGQSDLHDALMDLRDKQLVASNVESTTASSVTFLLKPETVCSSSDAVPLPAVGGASSTGSATGGTTSTLSPSCVANNTAHPTRIRISRIACAEGDNVAIEWLQGTASERLFVAELHADHADIHLDLGAWLRQSYNTSYTYVTSPNGTMTSEQRTEKPLVTSATGQLQGTLTLTGDQTAKGNVSITQAIDITLANTASDHLQFAACTNGITLEADGATKTIKAAVNANAFDWRTRLDYFINDFFGLATTAGAATADPVSVHIAGAQGTLEFNGAADTLSATGLSLGGADVTAKQGANTLLSFGAVNASQGAIAATFSGNTNNNLGIMLPQGLSVNIRYALQPVIALVTNPANFLANDTLTVSATANSSVALLNDSTTNELPALQSATGALLRVDTGTFGMSSSSWPNDAFTVPAGQCLTRTVTSSTDHHALLDDFTVGTCAAP